MNDKDNKVPIYIAILVAVILVAAGGYFVLDGKNHPQKSNMGEGYENSHTEYVIKSYGDGVYLIEPNTRLTDRNEIAESLSKGFIIVKSVCQIQYRTPLPDAILVETSNCVRAP